MPFVDRTGIKYGKLTAIKYMGKSKWLCKCDCGNEKIIYGGHLGNGHTKSCGCMRPPRNNLIGKNFGYLTPIEWLGNGKWLCECKCGNQTEVETSNLTSGNTKSCGCYQKEQASKTTLKSLIGQRFGKLLVIEQVENNKFGHTCYKCQCDCGGTTIVDSAHLRNGNTNSCGCIKSKGEMLINQWLQEHNINFKPQFSHPDIILESNRHPFFDFAIFDNKSNLLCFIEYNGKQHYQATGGWNTEETFKITQNRDKQKRNWCKKLNIPLYEIAYNENLELRMSEIMNTIKDTATAPDMEEAQEEVKE